MVKIQCPMCQWETQDLSDAFAVVLNTQLTTHIGDAHPPAAPPAVPPSAPAPQTPKLKLDSPKISVD